MGQVCFTANAAPAPTVFIALGAQCAKSCPLRPLSEYSMAGVRAKGGMLKKGQSISCITQGPCRAHDTYGVQHVLARQRVAGGDLGVARGLVMPLPLHQGAAGRAEAGAGLAVDGVVDAGVVPLEAPQQEPVGRVHDGVHPQSRDVPLPHHDFGAGGGQQRGGVGDLRRHGGDAGAGARHTTIHNITQPFQTTKKMTFSTSKSSHKFSFPTKNSSCPNFC